ncbi:DASH complex subunit Dad3-domain-containing protein [Vararia minispora EC-137]|uniref:DASH complex subunit Dad3-domain-containing protein n=1 Tax=Vararia minispora EC-137 TaxID=1314806 RepID=A0ACB8QMK8_9AGAM|nr:DASH complex subunit Dad3-domain-containing protein [Vararia minispora EC-137]
MSAQDVFQHNPYDDHPSLTPFEADVLWEYAKLSQHIKDLIVQTRRLSEKPDELLLKQLRILERKMGLVFTLFKASAWAVISDRDYAFDASGVQTDSILDSTAS